MRQPHVAEKSVVPFLVQDQLAVAAQSWVDFAVAVEIGGVVPGAVLVMQVKHSAFADIDKEADVLATPVIRDTVSCDDLEGTRRGRN